MARIRRMLSLDPRVVDYVDYRSREFGENLSTLVNVQWMERLKADADYQVYLQEKEKGESGA